MKFHSPKTYHRRALCSNDRGELDRYWNDITFAYSGLKLTFEKDKLPALSGVAKQMLSQRDGDEYISGLWRSTIISDLRWTSFERNSRRPSSYRAPSWSWASLDGTVQVMDYDIYTKSEAQNYAKCVDVSVILAGPDPTGEVSAGYLVLDAPLKIATLHRNKNSKGWWDRWLIGADNLTAEFSPDCHSDFQTGALTTSDKVMCVRLSESADSCDMCLVLKQRNIDGMTLYQRVGYFTHKREALETHWFGPDTQYGQVKIV
jgi:hypothetical protein